MRLLVIAGLALFLALAGIPSGPAATSTGRAAGETQGDVDCSGAADSIDALKVLLSVSGLPAVADCIEAAGDVDCSGARDSIDALRILGNVAGLPFTPPVGCTPIGDPLGPPGPTSFELIDAAEAAGEIDHETALKYTVFAGFGDERLPTEFESDTPIDTDLGAMAEIAYTFQSLSADTQAALAPYLLPPNDEASWHYQRYPAGGAGPAGAEQPCPECPNQLWGRIITANDKVKVWWQTRYPEDEAKAQALADALSTHIWNAETQMMGREPLSDDGLANNGHDGRLDMYIIGDIDFLGEMIPYNRSTDLHSWVTDPCKKAPAYILLNRTDKYSLETAGHELFHALQFSFDSLDGCAQRHWMQEATATWVEDFLYPDNNAEHRRTYWFDFPSVPLHQSDDNIGNYGRYVFFLYLTREHGTSVMRQIWENTGQYATVMEALDQAIPGRLVKFWPEFALAFWNRPPFAKLLDADNISGRPVPRDLQSRYTHQITHITLPPGQQLSEIEYALDASVPVVTTDYYHFQVVDAGGDIVPFVRFYNPYFSGRQATTKIQALVKIEGADWVLEDWTELRHRAFCRSTEKVTEVVLMASNSSYTSSMTADPNDDLVTARSSCGWHGEAKVTWLRDGGAGAATETRVTGTATDLLFVAEETAAGTTATPAGTTYKLVGGTLTWTYQPIEGFDGCTYTAEPLTVQLSNQFGELQTTPASGDNFDFRLFGVKPGQLTILRQCPDGNNTSSPFQLNFPWLCGKGTVAPDTTSVDGTERYFTTDESQTPAECPVQSQAQDDGSVHTQDFLSLTVDWEFHLEK